MIQGHWWMMHGYASYIWSAYALVLGVLSWNAYSAWARAKQIRLHLHKWLNDQ